MNIETLLGKPGHVYRNFGAVQEKTEAWLVRGQLHWRMELLLVGTGQKPKFYYIMNIEN